MERLTSPLTKVYPLRSTTSKSFHWRRIFTSLILLLSLLWGNSTTAQASDSIPPQSLRGVVKDQQNQPILGAVVFLIQGKAVIASVATDSLGQFALSIAPRKGDQLLLHAKAFGYKEWTQSPTPSPIQIRMEEEGQALGEVVVKGKQAQLRFNHGMTELNIAGTQFAKEPDIMEILRKIPNLRENNDQIELISGKKMDIYLNGRKIRAWSEVRNMDPRNIKSISIDNNPSSRYGLNMGAILHITTINRLDGLALVASANLSKRTYLTGNSSLQANYNQGKTNYFAEVYWYKQNSFEHNKIYTELSPIGNEAVRKLESDILAKIPYGNDLSYNIGFDRKESDQLSFGLRYSGNINGLKGTEVEENLLYEGNHLSDKVIGNNTISARDNYHHLNAYTDIALSPKLKLSFIADYYLKGNTRNQDILEQQPLQASPEKHLRMEGKSLSQLVAINPLLSYQIGQSQKVELGGEFTSINGTGKQSFPTTAIPAIDSKRQEWMESVFANYQLFGASWRAQVGLRFEFTQEHYLNLVNNQEKRNQYGIWGANMSLSKVIGKSQHSLSLSTAINRPSYQELYNSNLRSSQYVYQLSNPNLRHSQSYSASYQFGYGIFFGNIDYVYQRNSIEMSVDRLPNNQVGYQVTWSNLDYSLYTTIVMGMQKSWGWYDLNASINLMNQTLSPDAKISHRHFNSWVGRIYNSFRLPHEFNFSFDYTYASDQAFGTMRTGDMHLFNLRLLKSLNEGRWEFTLGLRDAFKQQGRIARNETEGIKLNLRQDPDSRQAYLSVKWRFNNYRNRYRGKDAASSAGRI